MKGFFADRRCLDGSRVLLTHSGHTGFVLDGIGVLIAHVRARSGLRLNTFWSLTIVFWITVSGSYMFLHFAG